jgi:hypothetical protein
MRAWQFVLLAGLLALGLGAAWLSMRPSETIGPLRGLRLGDSPARARDRFAPGVPGDFHSEAMGEDFALVWEATRPGEVRSARLEFHDALLVAARLRVAPSAPEADGPPIVLTEASLFTRERSRADVELTWIARSCPTHADEVRRRLASR